MYFLCFFISGTCSISKLVLLCGSIERYNKSKSKSKSKYTPVFLNCFVAAHQCATLMSIKTVHKVSK